jgi:hypothetical protein
LKTYRLVVDGRLFPICDEQELARTKRRIVMAVRRNGGFVTLQDAGGRPVDVLVTTATRVSVESAGEIGTEQPVRPGEQTPPREDFSRYSVDELSFDADLVF